METQTLSDKICNPGILRVEDIKEFIKDIEKKGLDARMYADMDEDDFWATSTISPQEAELIAKHIEEFMIFIRNLAGEKLI